MNFTKIVTPKEMARVEALAYAEGASEKNFMEMAGIGVAAITLDYIQKHGLSKNFLLLCGKGNNSGDAYAAGVKLLQEGYKGSALQIVPLEDATHLCKENAKRFTDHGGILDNIEKCNPTYFKSFDIILDGIFGTGFHGPVLEPYRTAIQMANESKKPIIAIDIPSGLNGETGKVEQIAIQATETAFLALPKQGFFLEDGWNYVGRLRQVDFGIPSKYLDQASSQMKMTCEKEIQALLPPIVRKRHKYQRGYVIGLSGSPGMPGAAMLSSYAALRGGAGIVRLLHPEGMQTELAPSPYELIRQSYPKGDNEIDEIMNRASATYVGPGLGRSKEVSVLLRSLLPKLIKPCVIDADALYFLSIEETTLPKYSLLTPHRGEMLRLLKLTSPPKSDLEWISLCQEYVNKHGVVLILKGGPSFIFQPESEVTINPSGDPGMATAGSGDVLTGFLASLLAQGLTLYHAAVLGVYLHGLAGEFAAEEKSSYGMIASDILEKIPNAYIALLYSHRE